MPDVLEYRTITTWQRDLFLHFSVTYYEINNHRSNFRVKIMAQQDILTLAKQGNPIAIAQLINFSLQSKGITAKAELRDECLHVCLDAAQVPEQQVLVPFIHKGMANLGAKDIKTVKIYMRDLDKKCLAWNEEIALSLDTDSTPPAVNQEERKTVPRRGTIKVKRRKKSVTVQIIIPERQKVVKKNPVKPIKAISLALGIIISIPLVIFSWLYGHWGGGDKNFNQTSKPQVQLTLPQKERVDFRKL